MIVFPPEATPQSIHGMLLSVLISALLWNTTMWRFSLPTSSSHALLGALLGAAWAQFGASSIAWPVVVKIIIGLGVVPLIASLVSFLLARFLYWLGEYLTPAVGGLLRGLQVFVLAGVALAHGSNDAQKSMALVVMALMAFGKVSPNHIPVWVAPACGLTLGLGVIIGSRRTVQTVGKGFYRVQNLQGLCAQGTTMLLVGASSEAGFPMATSHVMSSAVLGAGAAVRPSGIRWNVVGGVGLAWLFTIPGAAALAIMISYVVSKAL